MVQVCNVSPLNAQKLMMNDYEIIYWCIILEEIGINPEFFIDEMQLWALAVKRYLNSADRFEIFDTFYAKYRSEISSLFHLRQFKIPEISP